MKRAVLVSVVLAILVPPGCDAECLAVSTWIYEMKVQDCRVVDVGTVTSAAEDYAHRYRQNHPDFEMHEGYVDRILEHDPGIVLAGTALRGREIPTGLDDGEPIGPWQDIEAWREFSVGIRGGPPEGCWPVGLKEGQVVQVYVAPPCCDVIPPYEMACLLRLDQLWLTLPESVAERLGDPP